jgi:succinyl-diaminopimelate desuccinylase
VTTADQDGPSLADTLLWLCRIPSPIGEERALADALVERLRALQLAAPIRRYGDSLVVPLSRGGSGPTLVLGGHLDVVRTVHDGPARIEGDRLYAAGAADMKSGLALLLKLAETRRERLPNTTLVLYAREEGPYAENELGLVLDSDSELRAADFALMLEPSDNKLQLGCGGSVHATLRFEGRTAHSARPWQGENAIQKAAAVLTRLAARAPVPDELDGLTWHDVMSATLAQGGRARNIIPDLFELNVNHRFGPSGSIAASERAITELAAGEADVVFVDRSPPAPPSRHHPLVQALAASGVRAIESKQAWTDVGRFAALGIPAANFGPGVQAQAHQRNEWTLLSQLDEGFAILTRFLERVALLGVVLLVSMTQACRSESSGREHSRSEAVPTVPAPAAPRPLYTVDGITKAISALRERVDGAAGVLAIEIFPERLLIQVTNPTRDAVLAYEWTSEQMRGPLPVELRGSGTLASNVFPLSLVDLSSVPELARVARTRVDPEQGEVTRILVRRNLPIDESVSMRAYVSSPIRSSHLDADASGRPLDGARTP